MGSAVLVLAKNEKEKCHASVVTRRSMNCRETKRKRENVLTITGIEKIFFTGKNFLDRRNRKKKNEKNVGDVVIGRVFAKNQLS
jgi:hypothetical protein